MWEDAIELVHHRDEDIHRTTDEFASFKGQTRNGTRILDRLDLKLYNAVENNVSSSMSTVLSINSSLHFDGSFFCSCSVEFKV